MMAPETIDEMGISASERMIRPDLVEGTNYMRKWLYDRNRWEYYSKNPTPVQWGIIPPCKLNR